MKNVIMGTAGHVDHGKTALVKRLTGIDTDRLEEEKRRGMTIELGFAPFTLPSGNVISIVDVPGHEKFVKTMVAGVTGIDFVLLVIAADEGIMPQTREHIDILSLLDIKSGVVALTKTDLVDAEWLEMVREDVRKALAGTTLETIPIVPVSSVTGNGIADLIIVLERLSSEASERDVSEFFRLPVDRVFTIVGHGTVITGTVSGGRVSKGDSLELLPSGLTMRVRGIQVHNSNVDFASAGDRCALNVSGIEKDDISRGDVAAFPGVITPTTIADAVLYTVGGKEGISHNQRVHVNIGTKEVLARIRVIGADTISGGSRGYIQLRFEEPVAALREDRFIIRSYSPVTTIGGGWIVFHSTQSRQRFSEKSNEALTIGEHGTLEELVGYILKSSAKIYSIDDLWREIFIKKEIIREILRMGLAAGTVLELVETGKYFSKELYKKFAEKINAEFEQLYKKYPYRFQIDREEIKSKIFYELDSKDFTALLNHLTRDKLFELEGNYIVQPDNIAAKRILGLKEIAVVEKALAEDYLDTGNVKQLHQELRLDADKVEEIIEFLLKTGRVIDLGDSILLHSKVLMASIVKIRSYIDENGSITAAQARDCLGTGRKIAIALMEYLDGTGFTQRVDGKRIPGVHYKDKFDMDKSEEPEREVK